MDQLAELAGCRPTLSKYLWTDLSLWRALVFGPLVAYQYRLEGPQRWAGARQAILGVQERVEKPLKTRKCDDGNGGGLMGSPFFYGMVLLFLALLLYWLFL